MDAPRYIITYDIADRRRLSRTARLLERHALRIQKSVFLFSGGKRALDGLMAEIRTLIDRHEDAVEAWPLQKGGKKQVRFCGTPARVETSCLIVIGGRPISIDGRKEASHDVVGTE